VIVARPLFAQATVHEVDVDDPWHFWDVDVPQLLQYR
jgi:molybdenum cofactor cytidylyltransferase